MKILFFVGSKKQKELDVTEWARYPQYMWTCLCRKQQLGKNRSVQKQTDFFRHTQNQLTEIPHCKPTRNLQQAV